MKWRVIRKSPDFNLGPPQAWTHMNTHACPQAHHIYLHTITQSDLPYSVFLFSFIIHTDSSAIHGPVCSWVAEWISWLFLHLCFPHSVLTFNFWPFTYQLPQLLSSGGIGLLAVTSIREDGGVLKRTLFCTWLVSFAMLSSGSPQRRALLPHRCLQKSGQCKL